MGYFIAMLMGGGIGLVLMSVIFFIITLFVPKYNVPRLRNLLLFFFILGISMFLAVYILGGG